MRKKHIHLPRVSHPQNLSFGEKGLLPCGATVQKYIWGDIYEGTKEQLIASGMAKPEWFPFAPVPGVRPGTIKRSFNYKNGTRLQDLNKNGLWGLWIDAPEDEKARRNDELDQLREAECAQERNAKIAALFKEIENAKAAKEKEENCWRERIAFAAPVAADTLTEAELRLVRVMRTLSNVGRVKLAISANEYLADDAKGGFIQLRAPRPHLRLVVNNATA